MAKICVHAFVSGRVTGVWFRRFTQKKALSVGVIGWVRNLSDGRVEVMLCGDEPEVKSVAEWLQQGSPSARVENVEQEILEWREHEGFQVR